MKLSAVVLLGVNLVAASQVGANAADTASFLQDALVQGSGTAGKSGNKASASAKGKSAKSRQRSYVAMSPVVDGVQIRPFQPGRYLPSEAELKAKKQAELEARKQSELARQQAAYMQSGLLAGQVSYNGNNIFNHSMPSAVSALVPQSMPAYGAQPAYQQGANPYSISRPESQSYMQQAAQAAFHKVKQAAKNYMSTKAAARQGVPVVPEPTIPASARGIVIPQPPQEGQNHHVAAVPHVPAPPAQPARYDAGQFESLLDNGLGSINADMRVPMQGNPGLTGQGPPPYPLSSMQTGARPFSPMTPMAQRARFGDWHGGKQNLAQASFQSYVPIHTAGPMSIKVNHYNGAGSAPKRTQKTGRQALRMPAPSSQHIHPHKIAKISQNHSSQEARKSETKIASYAPYLRRYSGL